MACIFPPLDLMGSLINKMCKSIHISLLRFLAKLTKKKKDSNFSSLARMFYMHKHRTQYSILNFLLNLLKKKKKNLSFLLSLLSAYTATTAPQPTTTSTKTQKCHAIDQFQPPKHCCYRLNPQNSSIIPQN